jgi:hypothetical protein
VKYSIVNDRIGGKEDWRAGGEDRRTGGQED